VISFGIFLIGMAVFSCWVVIDMLAVEIRREGQEAPPASGVDWRER